MYDPEFGFFVSNSSDVATRQVMSALQSQAPEIAALARWSANTQGFGSRAGGLFDRDKFVTPEKIYDQMLLAQYASESDDVVSNVLESTESLAFSKMSFYCDDEDEEDVWNQIAADIDLDARLREMWRELFTVSQFYCAVWWGQKTYKVRGKTNKGNEKRKTFKDLKVPTALTMLDPLKVVPIGMSMFNRERLAWIADRSESDRYEAVLADPLSDPILGRLLLRRYEPSREEVARLSEAGFNVGAGGRLFELNPDAVFRHTATRPQYQHFASVRMRSVFELLDLKNQLRQMDRAHLIGATNFIVVITKGSDLLPAKPAEIENLQAQVRTVARVPVLVGDHRLKVEIVTPKIDQTLSAERYNAIDSRLTARLYQMFLLGNFAAGASNDKSENLMKVVARGMESRRQMIKRSLERQIFQAAVARNQDLTSRPELRFHPRQIALDFDSNFASFLLELRAANEISRETILSQFDMDQDDEFRMLEREREKYDDVFMTQVPFAAPNPANPAPMSTTQKKAAGRIGGGNRNGGGAAPGTGQGQAPRRPRKTSDQGKTKLAAGEESE